MTRRHAIARLAYGGAVVLVLGGAAWVQAGGAGAAPVTLVAKEFLYEPREATARTGPVIFVIKNEGAIEHNFVLQDAAKRKVAEIAVIEPGTSAEVKATVAPGTYGIICTLPGHRQAGMVATLKVAP